MKMDTESTPGTQSTGSTRGGSPSLFSSALRVFDISVGEMLWSRRTIFMALVVGGPVVIALAVRAALFLTGRVGRVDGVAMTGQAMFGMMIWFFYLRFTVPVLGVFYGTALIADEVEDKTLTYLFTRPVRRGAVLLGKYLAYFAVTSLVVLPSVMIVWLLIAPIGGTGLAVSFIPLLKDLALLAIGLGAYGALFAFIGAKFKRPLLTGLIFVFGWEQAALMIPGYLKKFTIAYYVQALVPHAMPQEGVMSLIQGLFRDTPSLPVSLLCLAIIWFGFLWLAARTVERKEYVLEQ